MKKRLQFPLFIYVISLLFLLSLSYFFDLYPYGLHYDLTDDNTLEVKKGIIAAETYVLKAGEENRLALMAGIQSLINNWMLFLIIFCLLPAGAPGLFNQKWRLHFKLSTYAALYFSMAIVIVVAGTLFFQSQAAELIDLLPEQG